MIVAIDGPAGAGKGTLAERIAKHYGLPHLDTGALYRAVARDLQTRGLRLDDVWGAVTAARALDPSTLSDPTLRGRAAGEAASIVAKIPEVRTALLNFQRNFANQPSGAVLDGRDIGTVICPDATVKIFVTATVEERARRRYNELKAKGIAITEAVVLQQLRDRDKRDGERAVAPMKPATDAALLDTTHLDIDAAFRAAVDLIETKTGLFGRSSLRGAP